MLETIVSVFRSSQTTLGPKDRVPGFTNFYVVCSFLVLFFGSLNARNFGRCNGCSDNAAIRTGSTFLFSFSPRNVDAIGRSIKAGTAGYLDVLGLGVLFSRVVLGHFHWHVQVSSQQTLRNGQEEASVKIRIRRAEG